MWRRRRVQRDNHTAYLLVALLILASLALLVFDWYGGNVGQRIGRITGAAPSATTSLSIEIVNRAPQINEIVVPSPVSITEGGVVYSSFTFNATDPYGIDDLNDSTATGVFNITGYGIAPGQLANVSCRLVDSSDGDSQRYNCSVPVQYFDTHGNWTVNASVGDNGELNASNASSTFEIYQTIAMVMSPTALTWATVSLGQTNRTASNNPITINNTGNKNISINTSVGESGIAITAIDLQGATNASKFIFAVNFTVANETGGNNIECDTTAPIGTTMLNTTASGLTRAVNHTILTRGNLSDNKGNETLYFCLLKVQTDLSPQTYSTSGGGSWTVTVS